MKLSNEVKIGILAIVTILGSIWGFKFLKGQNMIGHSVNLYVEYDDALRLTKSSPVSYKGVDVGTVSDIHFMPKGNTQKAIVVVNLKIPINAPKNAVAVLYVDGFLGGKAVEITFDTPCQGSNCAVDGDTIKGITKSLLQSMVGDPTTVQNYVQPLSDGAIHLMDTLNYSLRQPNNEVGKTLRDMQSVVANLKATTNALNLLMAASAGDIGSTMKHFNAISANLESSNHQIRSILSNIDTMSSGLKGLNVVKTNDSATAALSTLRRTLVTTDTAIAQLKEMALKLKAGQGSVSQILNSDSLYNNINLTLLHFQALTQDLRLNPRRYVNLNPFKSYKPYVLPENDPLIIKLYQLKKDSIIK